MFDAARWSLSRIPSHSQILNIKLAGPGRPSGRAAPAPARLLAGRGRPRKDSNRQNPLIPANNMLHFLDLNGCLQTMHLHEANEQFCARHLTHHPAAGAGTQEAVLTQTSAEVFIARFREIRARSLGNRKAE
eukprot:767637-Hanusia_phi.AAC.6